MRIEYTGTSDFQEFSKADFAQAGVEQGKLSFPKNKPVEVPDEVAQALLSKEGVFGSFSFSEAKDEPEAQPELNLQRDPVDNPLTEGGNPPPEVPRTKK